MKKLLLSPLLFFCLRLLAQLPEDALRGSWIVPGGSARQQAIGGAMGSLGGDISANYVNPAGLGLYRTSELVISPGWSMLRDKSSYLNTGTKGPRVNNFSLGTSGLVTSHIGSNGNSTVFSIAVNRTANFNNHIHYSGTNSYSSSAEQYSEEFANSGLNIQDGIANPSLSYGTRMALYTYLIDTATVNGQSQVVAAPQKVGTVLQDNDLRSTGGITEIALNLAGGIQDKWFIGGGLGIPILQYDRYQTYQESDASGNANNDFESFLYQEHSRSRGWGLNAKLGVLFKASNAWRLGLAVHTPTVFSLTNEVHASMSTRTEAYAGVKEISSDELDALTQNNPSNVVSYNFYTPWRFLLSGSYVFGGDAENIKAQKGFITADMEYITTGSSSFSPRDEDNATQGEQDYFDGINQAIKGNYKNTLALRLGGELKFSAFMVRAGGAYYSNPYKDNSELKADRLYLSAGAGYRNRGGYFIDLAYIMGFTRDVNFPYRLADKNNIIANLKENSGTLMLTFGVKL